MSERIALLVGVFVTAAACAQTSAQPPKPNPKQPVDYVRWLNDRFTKAEGAATGERYLAAAAKYVADEAAQKLTAEKPPPRWTSADREALQAWVDRNAACLDEVVAISKAPACSFALSSASGSTADVKLPELQALRSCCRALAVRAALRGIDGAPDGAGDDALAIIRIGDHLQAQPMLPMYLAGAAAQALGYRAAVDGAVLSKRADLEAIRRQLATGTKPPRSIVPALEVERVLAWDFVQRCLKDGDNDGKFDAALMPQEGGSPKITPLSPAQTLAEVLADIGTVVDPLIAAAQSPWVQARPKLAAVKAAREKLEGRAAGLAVADAGPAIGFAIRLGGERQASLVILDLHAYHKKHNRWPEKLDDAVPAADRALLTDPYSGKPFIYVLKAGEPLLYSVSENGDDNGGAIFRRGGHPTVGETGDWVLWPRPE